MRPSAARAAGACLLFLAACAGGDAGAGAESVETRFSEEGGTIRVESTGTPASWSAREFLRVGRVEGDGPEVFGQLRSLVADGEGRVYAADGQAREIRVFDADGRHLRTLGRPGSGPGEFANLMAVAFLGDTLAALDPGNARIQLFDPLGAPAGTRPATGATGPPSVFQPKRVGDVELWARDVRRRPEGGLETVFVRHTTAGASDTLAAPAPPRGAFSGVRCEGEDVLSFFSFPSAPGLVDDIVADGRRLSMWTSERRFALLSAAGDTVRTVTWTRPPVPLDDAAWEAETEEFRAFRRSRSGARCDPAAPVRPPHRSTARAAMSDDAGRIWIESAVAEGWVWDVFDAEGRWLAEFAPPPRSPGVPAYVRGDRYYQVETDDLDVQSVVGYRITRD